MDARQIRQCDRRPGDSGEGVREGGVSAAGE